MLVAPFFLSTRYSAGWDGLPSPFCYCLSYLPAVWGSPGDPLALVIGGHTVDWTIFSLLAAPLIFWPTHTGVKINRWFFYIFYPAHLALIVLVKYLVSIA